MTKLEAVRLIGDVLTEIDIVIGSLDRRDPNQLKLHDARLLLDDRQRRLSRTVFNESTEAFQIASHQLSGINDQVRSTLNDTENVVAVVNCVFRGKVNAVPGRSRTLFRDDSDHHSGMKANTIPVVVHRNNAAGRINENVVFHNITGDTTHSIVGGSTTFAAFSGQLT